MLASINGKSKLHRSAADCECPVYMMENTCWQESGTYSVMVGHSHSADEQVNIACVASFIAHGVLQGVLTISGTRRHVGSTRSVGDAYK